MVAAQRDPAVSWATRPLDEAFEDLPARRAAIDQIAQEHHDGAFAGRRGVRFDQGDQLVEEAAHAVDVAHAVMDGRAQLGRVAADRLGRLAIQGARRALANAQRASD